MLVLTRRKGESITIGKDVTITVIESGSQVRIGISAPDDVPVHRLEIAESIGREEFTARPKHERVKNHG